MVVHRVKMRRTVSVDVTVSALQNEKSRPEKHYRRLARAEHIQYEMIKVIFRINPAIQIAVDPIQAGAVLGVISNRTKPWSISLLMAILRFSS